MPKVPKKTPKKANALLDGDEDKGKTKSTEDNSKADEGAEKSEGKADGKTPAKANVDKAMKSDIEATRIALSKEETVHFMIPLALGEKAGAFEDVWINGFHTRVPKGVMSILPQSIADLLANKYAVEATAGAEFRLDLDPEKQDKLS
jgi:hypothetical protein